MGEENTPTSSGQAPPTSSPPVGTPTTAQAATQQPKYTFNSLEEATAFAERMRLDKSEANRQAQEANNEMKALRQQVETLVVQQKAAQAKAIAADVQFQAKTLGFRNPAFVYGAIANQLQYGADGMPTNATTLLEALKQSESYLLETPAPANNQQTPPEPKPAAAPRVPPTNPSRSASEPAITVDYVLSLKAKDYALLPRAQVLAIRQFMADHASEIQARKAQ